MLLHAGRLYVIKKKLLSIREIIRKNKKYNTFYLRDIIISYWNVLIRILHRFHVIAFQNIFVGSV